MASVELEAAYSQVEAALSGSITDDLRAIRRLTSGVIDANGLTDAVRILETSVRLRDATSRMTEAYFSARFNVSRPKDARSSVHSTRSITEAEP